MNTITNTLIAAVLGAFAISASAHSTGIKDPLGVPIAQEQAERTVQIDGNTHVVNVKRMENVRFVVGNGSDAKTFAWRFDGLPQRNFKLSQIAPASALGGQDVTVYVARDAQLDGGR
jgi:hypothetical protein